MPKPFAALFAVLFAALNDAADRLAWRCVAGSCGLLLLAVLPVDGQAGGQAGGPPAEPSWTRYPLFDPWGVMPPELAAQPLPGDAEARQACEAPAAGEALTLARALELNLCRNPQTQAAWADARAKAAQIGVARAGYLPTVNASVARTRDELDQEVTGNGTPGSGARTDSRIIAYGRNLTLNWLLLDLGARGASQDQARQVFEAALASHSATVQAALADTAQAYYDTWAAQAAARAAREAEASARENLLAAQARARLGVATRLDELQAQSALSKATLDRVRAEGDERQALGTLAATLGLDARTPLHLAPDPGLAGPADAEAMAVPSSGPPTPKAPPDATANALAGEAAAGAAFLSQLGALMDEATERHPSVQAARAQLEAARSRREVVRAEGLPSVSLSAGRYISGRPNNSLSQTKSFETVTSLTLNIPLFEGLARNYRIHEAEAQVSQREAELAGTQAQIGLEAWRSYQTLAAETAAVSASADLVRGSREALDAARARYRVGGASLLEVLTAQKDQAEAEQERIRSVAAWRAARLRLLASLGRLGYWALDPTLDAGTVMPLR